MVNGKTICVTGAGGFIGSAVVKALVDQGAAVRTLIGAPGDLVREPPPGVPGIRAEITDTAAICPLIAGAEVVVHLAGPALVSASFEAAGEYARVHVDGTVALLDLCRSLGVKHFIYMSSAEVYGRPHTHPVREDHPLQARSPYAAAKIGAERFVEAFALAFGMQVVILRPFSIYGPGLSPHSLIGTIVQQALRGTAVRLAHLQPVRDYCCVDDLAAAVVRACTARLSNPFIANIGTGIGTSVAELATLILGKLGRAIPVQEEPWRRRPGHSEIYSLVADARLARETLGWMPKFPLPYGLERLIHTMI